MTSSAMSSGAAPQQISAAEVIQLWQNYQMLESEDENELDDGCDEQNEARSVTGRDKIAHLERFLHAFGMLSKEQRIEFHLLVMTEPVSSTLSRDLLLFIHKICNSPKSVASVVDASDEISRRRSRSNSAERSGIADDTTQAGNGTNSLNSDEEESIDGERQCQNLREFLLEGIGGRLLQTLARIGSRDIANEREFATVLIRILPTKKWRNSHKAELCYDSEYNSLLVQLLEDWYKIDEQLIRSLLSKAINAITIPDIRLEISDAFDCSSVRITSTQDQLTLYILNLLEGFAFIEDVFEYDEHCITVNCLRMAIGRLTQHELLEECPRNRLIIRHKLIGVLISCLTNLYYRSPFAIVHVSLKQIYEQVMEVLRIEMKIYSSDPISCDSIYNLMYIIVSIINRLFAHFCGNLVSEQFFWSTFKLFESDLDVIKDVYNRLHASNHNTHGKIIDILVKMHRNFVTKVVPNRTNGRQVSIEQHRVHHSCQHPRAEYVCALENILLNLFPAVQYSEQRALLKFFSESQFCCCNATIRMLEVLLRRPNFELVQRICLNFASRNIIQVIFDESDCDTCNRERLDVCFNERFASVHRDVFTAYARLEERFRMPILLKYLLDVANVVPPKLAEVLLFDLVMPQLRKELDRFEGDGTVDETTKEIVNGCLQIVARCLRNVNLFEALFTEDNREMFAKLSRRAEFVYQVGVILGLGIKREHKSQHKEVQSQLSKMLIDNLRGLSEYLGHLFRTLKTSDVQIELKVAFPKSVDVTLRNEQTADMLQRCVEHWKLTRYLLQVDRRFYCAFVDHFDDAESFLLLVYNLFSLLVYNGHKRSPPPLSELTDLGESASPERRSILNIFHFNDQLLDNHQLPTEDIFYGNDSTSSSHQEDEDFSFLHEATMKSILKLPTASQETLDNGRMEKNWSLMDVFNIKNYVGELVDEYITGTKSPIRQEDLPDQVRQLLSTGGFIRKRLAMLAELMLSTVQLLTKENNRLDDAMQSALFELKKLLLSRAFEDWNSSETTKNVMNALQWLLKIAEVRCQSAPGEIMDALRQDDYYFPVYPFDGKGSPNTEDDISSTDESFTTAFDDGYEGDGECDPFLPPGVTGKDSLPAKRFGSVMINQNIYLIVADILMELSKKCAKNPQNWCPVLAQMVLKLRGIKEHLGGSLDLISGFGPILAKSDIQLKELQISVLELITDLESPKVFAKYLQLLSLEDPPVRLILTKLMNIVDKKFKLECYTEIAFPDPNGYGTIVSTCDVMLSRKINYLREHHLYYNIRSPYTCSAKIIPLNCLNFYPWNAEGSTGSVWFRLNPNQQDSNRLTLTHLISVGSEKQIVSVFLNRQRQFTVRLNKPDLIISSANTKRYLENAAGVSCCENCAKELSHIWSYKPTMRSIQSTEQAFRIDTPGAQCVYCYKQLRVGRREPLTSRLSNDYYYDLHSGQYLVKDLQLTDDRWHMLVLSIQQLDVYISVVLTLDGVQQETLTITDPCKIHTNTALPVLAIGHCIGVEDDIPIAYSLSNVQLFGKSITDISILANLYAVGPNWIDVTGFLNGESISNYGSLDLSKLTLEDLQPGNAFEQIKRSHVGYYTAHKPDQFFSNKSATGKIILGMMNFSPCITPRENTSLQRSILLSGGITTILFAFARVVELTECSRIHADALNLLLRVAHDNHDFYNEFIQRDLLELVGIVLKNNKCRKEICVLAALLEVTFDKPVLIRKNDTYSVRSNSLARIRYPEIIIFFFENFHIWIDHSEEVLNLVFEILTVITREKHPGMGYNSKRLAAAGLVPTLIDFCRMNFVIPSRSIKISKFAADSLVMLITILSGSPPKVSLLKEIIELLLLMHKPTDSYVTHDRQKFYFNINAQFSSRSPKSGDTKIALRLGSRERRLKLAKVIPLALSTSTNTSLESTTSCIELARLNSRKSESSDSTVNTPKSVSANQDANYSKLNEALSNVSIRRRHLKTVKRKVRRLRTQSTRMCRNPKEGVLTPKSCASKESQRSTQSLPIKFKFFEQNYFGTGNDFIQESFLRAMCDYLLILPDNEAREFFDAGNKIIETILILANNSNIRIRAVIINLIAVISDRVFGGSSAQLNYTDEDFKNFWHHLGNQIGSHSVNVDLVNCCLRWITKSSVVLGLESSVYFHQFDVVQESGLNVLQAILPQSYVDPRLFQLVLNLIDSFYTNHPKAAHYMVENGLIWTVVKTAIKMHEKGDCEQTSSLDGYVEFVTQFAYRSLSSANFLNPFWDLVNGLTLAERHKNPKVTQGIRRIHAMLFQNTLNFFIYRPVESIMVQRNNSFTVELRECSLAKAELKVRYNQIHDKAVQFIVSCGADHRITDSEMSLIKDLIKRTLNGNPRGGNIILWCLLPKRPIYLKLYTIKQLGQYLDGGNYLSQICDVRMLKVYTQSILLLSKKDMSPEDVSFVTTFYQAIEGTQSSSWTLTQTLEEFDYLRMVSLNDQEQIILKSISKQEKRIHVCTVTAMDITRKIVENQNKLRKELLILLKKDSDFKFFNQWRQIIEQMTHEDAPWYNAKLYPSSWELDDTYGSDLAQKRLRRCRMTVDQRFLQKEVCSGVDEGKREQLLAYLMPKNRSQEFSMENQVLYTSTVEQISPKQELESECILTSMELVLSPVTGEIDIYDLDSISKIWTKRFQHQETAVEIFFKTSKSLFLVFNSQIERETFAGFFQDLVQREGRQELEMQTQLWRDGSLSNWEYLMHLNQISGRSYHDLMQYPVFPWILADYDSSQLDLLTAKTFRNLEKPIAVQYKELETHYINNYNYLKQAENESTRNVTIHPYHYSSHYSNSGTVLHFLVRMLPFTSLFLQYQDDSFDIPDRTFHSLCTTWNLASRDSPTDVKELIPEFFCLPEFLENLECFDFGVRQSGEPVNHVELPVWSNQSARLFALIHRQALESDYVRKRISHWIDLIFGYKQTGPAAVEAINVFHPATYSTFSTSHIEDAVEKLALETMIKTYGQMPRQLFDAPHTQANITPLGVNGPEVVENVVGLKWGLYSGTPVLPSPKIVDMRTSAKNLASLVQTDCNKIVGLPTRTNVFRGLNLKGHFVVDWGQMDGVIRVRSIQDNDIKSNVLVYNTGIDPITACGSDPSCPDIWFGHRSGRIVVFQQRPMRKASFFNQNIQPAVTRTRSSSFRRWIDRKSATLRKKLEGDDNGEYSSNSSAAIKWNFPVALIKHQAEITAISMCPEFKIVVSASMDGVATIWDYNSLSYVREIPKPVNVIHSRITLVSISPTLGDIVTIHSSRESGALPNRLDDLSTLVDDDSIEVTENYSSDYVNIMMGSSRDQLRLHTVNAKYVEHVFLESAVVSVCYTSVKEGCGVNCIAVGLESGTIRLYSSWNLALVREITMNSFDVYGIRSLIYSRNQHLIVLTTSNVIQTWKSEGLPGTSPQILELPVRRSIS